MLTEFLLNKILLHTTTHVLMYVFDVNFFVDYHLGSEDISSKERLPSSALTEVMLRYAYLHS